MHALTPATDIEVDMMIKEASQCFLLSVFMIKHIGFDLDGDGQINYGCRANRNVWLEFITGCVAVFLFWFDPNLRFFQLLYNFFRNIEKLIV